MTGDCSNKTIFRTTIIANYYLAALLLIIAGILKTIHPAVSDLLQALFEQGLLSFDAVLTVSRFQPGAEIMVGLLAVSGWRAEWSAKFLAAVYLFFTLLILYASQGYLTLPIDCGCFGGEHETPVYLLLLRNSLIAALLVFFDISHRRWTLFYGLFQRSNS